ncbi:MAG TPA: Eco57I restriction-modification methylase domain-containing protein [Actinomycetota bacterium]
MAIRNQLKLMPESPLDLSVRFGEDTDVEHGAVFTRRWVVDLILDLVGYTPDRNLHELVAIEPSCGDGAFLVPMVERLVEACRRAGADIGAATDALSAFDLQAESVTRSRKAVREVLLHSGCSDDAAAGLSEAWVSHDDFLLASPDPESCDFVIGNPPYIRLENVPEVRQRAYRRAWPTMTGRSDIYVGFFEAGLNALRPSGKLAFICADRWMRNQYGRHLRRTIASDFALDALIVMHDVDAFEDEVSAYPAICVLRREEQGPVIAVEAHQSFDAAAAERLKAWAGTAHAADISGAESYDAAVLPTWFGGVESWPTGSPERLKLLADLESRFPPLEDPSTGTRVGIGVATGADQVFLTTEPDLVEPERLLPLAMAADTKSGAMQWSGHYLVNPWNANACELVRLADYPRLRKHFLAHEDALRGRNVGKRKPDQWYRTIDPVHHWLTSREKLLFPDIKNVIHPVLDEGKLYPHHNLYYVMSRDWPIDVLGGLLLSRVAQLFVESYAVRMRGGWLRFQAQYLRRIRLPRREAVTKRAATVLSESFFSRDVESATACAMELYGIDELPR